MERCKIIRIDYNRHDSSHLKRRVRVSGKLEVLDYPPVEDEINKYLADGWTIIHMEHSASGGFYFCLAK